MLTAIDACILTRKTTGITREHELHAGLDCVTVGAILADNECSWRDIVRIDTDALTPAPLPRETAYAALIREIAPKADPRHVEAYIRLEHSTLGGLSREQFEFEVGIALACIATVGAEQAERCARSFGL
jgi:hypothetical protein